MEKTGSHELEKLVTDLGKEGIVIKIESTKDGLHEVISGQCSGGCSQGSCSGGSGHRGFEDLLENGYKEAA